MTSLVEVADGVLVVTHPFDTTTSTVVVGTDGRSCLVVDPAVTASEIDDLAVALARRGLAVEGGFSTHPHWDHLLWRDALGSGPRWATAAAARTAREQVTENEAKARAALAGVDTRPLAAVDALDPVATSLPWAGRSVRVLEHRAHAPGHAALLVEDVGVLVAGDMLSDVEVPLPDLDAPTPWDDYAAALDTFEAVAEAAAGAVQVVVPGHGYVGDRAELDRRIAADRAYLDALLRDGDSDDPRLAAGPTWLRETHADARERARADRDRAPR